MIKLSVDLLGSDKGERELLNGVLYALKENDNLFLYLCGHADVIESFFAEYKELQSRFRIVDAPMVISNNENPAEAMKTKPNASMIKAIRLCKEQEDIGGVVSCGATGGLMVTSIMILKTIPHATPTLLCEVNKIDGSRACIADCGANIDVRADKIISFAKIGTAYMKAMGIDNPKVMLLSNGAEDKKGTEFVKSANALLRNSSLNFCGNIEGSSVLSGDADVVVCDGFSGNILLKSLEGGANALIKEMERFSDSEYFKNNAEYKSFIKSMSNKYNYNTQGGAVLLGVNKPVIKGHGSATAETMKNIIELACSLVKNDITKQINALV